MDDNEIAQELIMFLNEFGHYNEFLIWAEGRGFDRDELEADMLRIEKEL